MKSKFTKIISAIFLIALTLTGCLLIYLKFFFDPYEMARNLPRNPFDDPPGGYDYFQIDPSTIMTDLMHEKNNVFHLLEAEPKSFQDIYPAGTFPWSQEDYLMIAEAHLLYLTEETVDDGWKIYRFGSLGVHQCGNNIQGFDSAHVIYFKKNPDGSFPATFIYIHPLEGLIYSSSTKYDAREGDFGFSEAEVMKGSITADDALQIAEEAGGKEMRKKLSNEGCGLFVSYFGDEYWHVDYSWNTDNLDFYLAFEVNANNGSYKVSRKVDKCKRAICP